MQQTDEILTVQTSTPFGWTAPEPAVSWQAVLGGAFGGASLSVILLALGAGFGLAVVSPFGLAARHETALAASAIVWLLVTQVASSALGGYLAGRLRTMWTGIHGDEAHFRDSAHGFLAWAVGVVVCASLLGASIGTLTGTHAASNASENMLAYRVDSLLRGPNATAPANDVVRGEAGRLLARLTAGPDDQDRLALIQLVNEFANLPPADAAVRVDAQVLRARQALDNERKDTARILLWVALALLMGAFTSSHFATVGGRQRMRAQLA